MEKMPSFQLRVGNQTSRGSRQLMVSHIFEKRLDSMIVRRGLSDSKCWHKIGVIQGGGGGGGGG